MRTTVGILIAAIVLTGCAPTSEKTASPQKRLASEAPKPLTLQGPGGTVGIGDTLDQAKAAFPPPKDAQVFNSAMSFTLLKLEGWAWVSDSKGEAFEVGLRGGKIVALGHTGGDTSAEPQRTIDEIGPPIRKAQTSRASLLVWESGSNARFWLNMNTASQVLPKVTLTIIGDKEELKKLSYNHNDPDAFLRDIQVSGERT